MAALISVCMPAYNGERYIKAQLESILRSPLVSEVLVSDDGSSDRTVEIVKAIPDPRIRLLNGPRAGVIKNCEFLLSRAAGDHIFLSDQDDIWSEDKVAVMLSELQTVDLAVSDCTVVDADLNLVHPSFFALRGSRPGLFRNLVRNSYLGCCMAFNRRLVRHVLPFPDGLPMHDWWIGLVAESFGGASFIDAPLISYRRHGGNASSASEPSTASLRLRWQWRALLATELLRRRLRR